MLEKYRLEPPQGLRAKINNAYRCDEPNLLTFLLEQAALSPQQAQTAHDEAASLVGKVRVARKKNTGIDSFLMQYSLSTAEGIALMCLAEALLRVPDNYTIDKLIKDKLLAADWKSHRGQSSSFFVNAATWALMLTGKVLTPESAESTLSKALLHLINRSGEPVVRKAVDKAMRIMSKQFVMGRTITEALQRAQKKEKLGYRYSYDMLGEAALTDKDAERYFQAYKNAITAIGSQGFSGQSVYQRPGISIKLSALHPRYQEAQRQAVLHELTPRLLALAQTAKQYDIALTIDAEESERLELSLDIIEEVFNDYSLDGWLGFGVAVQSYQKRAFFLIDWLAQLARDKGRRIMIRLIKGAYWDSEIKKAQMLALPDYPVFTKKVFTDISFQACAKKLFTLTDVIYPQFATHNAYSVAMILQLAGGYRDFEFQRLHGMGKELFEQIVPKNCYGIACRIYAPVGGHEELLPYLVRRLLENGANSSFVNRIADEKAAIDSLIIDPIIKAENLLLDYQRRIPLPTDIFLPGRKNALGFDFTDRAEVANLQEVLRNLPLGQWQGAPILAAGNSIGAKMAVLSPQTGQTIGFNIEATMADVESALQQSCDFREIWQQVPVRQRADALEKFAQLVQANQAELMALLCYEAGKTFPDALGEIRETIDFCYYYAQQARALLSQPRLLQGYTGETNELSLHPRGVALCISPWNFPLAIFAGQIIAALVVGNCVIAKPAEQTPLIASFAVKLMHAAGIPRPALQLLPGDGGKIGAALVSDERINLVLFTGSTQTARLINTILAQRAGSLTPFIAETGGINAMIVDSSALIEQVIGDVLSSAFGSAGQRCSALRMVYVQQEVYPRFVQLLQGAMAKLRVANPQWLDTDIGPVIDAEALLALEHYVIKMSQNFPILYQCSTNRECEGGHFMPPTAIAVNSINDVPAEVFGPILHVASFTQDKLDEVIQDINGKGYGLTLGIHSRINQTIAYIRNRIHVGNCYVNRTMVGAVVGLQPFGGEGLSGTGPKAGGPNYLARLCVERTFTVDTTAAGGNASLLAEAD